MKFFHSQEIQLKEFEQNIVLILINLLVGNYMFCLFNKVNILINQHEMILKH